MIIDLNKKTVQELRQRCRELLDEGILDASRTEISRARKAELIEWIEFYDDDEDDQEKIINLMETIDNHDDVNNVYSNFILSSNV